MNRPTKTPREFLGWLANQEKRREAEQAINAQLAISSESAYRWGRLSPRDAHFNPQSFSGDAAIYDSQDLMNRRVRSERRNNAQIKRIVEAITDLVVGVGIQTLADPFDYSFDLTTSSNADLDDHLRIALESDEKFDEWFSDPELFDVSGKLSGNDMCRLAMSECVEVGDSLILRCRKPRRKGVSLCYQIIERDQLDYTQDRMGDANTNRIVNGIEVDAQGREVAFYIYDAHPYDSWTGNAGTKSTRIPANRVTHLYNFLRPSQNIGVSWLHAIGQNNLDRDSFMSSEVQCAAKAAKILLVYKMANMASTGSGPFGLEDGSGSTDAYGNQQIRLGSSPLAARIGKDDDLEIVESNRPNSKAESFFKLLDRDTAAGAGISYYSLTGDYEATSFSSARAAKIDEDAHAKPIQNWFASRVSLPIRREFTKEAIALNVIRGISPAEFLANESRYLRFDAMGPGRDMLDPEAETNAASGRCRSAFSNLKIECAKRGLHWIRVLRQMAVEKRVSELLGVTVDFSKGQGGQVEKTTTSANTTPSRSKGSK